MLKKEIPIEKYASLPVKYLSLVRMVNQLIEQSLVEQKGEDED